MRTRIAKPLLFASPALLLYLIFWVIPIFMSLFMSFYQTTGFGANWTFKGLDNYRHILTDNTFYISLVNNLKWMGLSILFPTIIGLCFALMLNSRIKLQTMFRGIFYYPCVLSMVSVGLIWSWIFHPSGIFVDFQKAIGITKPLVMMAGIDTALYGVFIAGAWASIGTGVVLFLAGLQTIPSEIHEMAMVEGANFFQKFWYITLPLLRQTFIIVITLALINSVRVFDIVMATTRGGPGTGTYMLGIYMYINAFKSMYFGLGSAVSWLMVILVAIPVIPYIWVMQSSDT